MKNDDQPDYLDWLVRPPAMVMMIAAIRPDSGPLPGPPTMIPTPMTATRIGEELIVWR